MNKRDFNESFCANPIIAAVRNVRDLDESTNCNVTSIFLLAGNLLNIKKLTKYCRDRSKNVFLHADMIDGLGNDTGAVQYIAEEVKPDGIISTRNSIIKHAKESGLVTIQRCFCMDSLALQTGLKSIEQTNPDAIELLPGIIPRIIALVALQTKKPIITGGMINCKEDVIASLRAGAIAISTSCKELWNK